MERKVDKFLEHWRMDQNRKPLVIYGGKQVGKTYTALKFGEYNYSNVVYIDSDDNMNFVKVLKKQNTMEGIISSISEFTKGGRDDLVESTSKEIEILSTYLPEQLTEEEVNNIIEKVFEEVKPESPKDMGKVMKTVTPLVKGKADMGLVSSIIKGKLN